MAAVESRLAFDLCDTWQAKVLLAAQAKTDGVTGAVALSVMAHNFDDAMPVLLQVLFPGFTSIAAPFLCSAGRVDKTGAVVANVVNKSGGIQKDYVLYRSEIELRDDFRKLADQIKLNDADRREMFAAV